MLISIIIPAYNAQRYLRQTLQSVLSQTGGRLEILVVNDGSTDDTGRIAEDYTRRHSCIRVIHTENRGVSHARNVGIREARGRYVSFLDADDVLCADAYTPELEAVLDKGEYDLLSFGYFSSDHNLHYGRANPEQTRVLTREDPGFLRLANQKSFSARLYRRELLKNIRFFEGIRYAEDSVFSYLAFHRARNLACFDRYWFLYRNNLHSALHNTDGWQFLLTDCIPAWFLAADNSGDASGRWDCWGMVYSSMAQYVRHSIMSGVPLDRLLSRMNGCREFQQVLAHRGQFWTLPDADRLFFDLYRAPRRTWLKLRLKGILPSTAMRLSRTALLRPVYFRMKYRMPMGSFLSRGLGRPIPAI